jgi:hypothetical protein
MEPENKKEIMIGWWKFVGLQAAAVLVMSLVFYFSSLFPHKMEMDYKAYLQRRNEDLKKVSEAYLSMSPIKTVVEIVESGKDLDPVKKDKFEKICEDISSQAAKSGREWDAMPDAYQDLAKKYIKTKEDLKIAGNCPALLSNLQKDNKNLQNQYDNLDIDFKALKGKVALKCPDCL